jgi:hypothetical protein
MTPRCRSWALAACGLALASTSLPAQDADRIYGRVSTAAGDVYEGYIRWDRNEGSWVDLLNGTRDLDPDVLALAGEVEDEDRRARSVEFLGVRISWNEDDDHPSSAESGIRFGHVRSLRVTGDDDALLTLKSGEEVELRGGSTDLGDELRELLVEDPDRGTIELEWRDLDRIDFFEVPGGAAPASARRLYGTAEDRWGGRYTGWLSWDLDEILGSDVLDGEERGRDREIRFELIEGIERDGSSGSRVFLRSGEEVVLRGSNDVASGHRGVQISDPGLGQVEVEWGELASVRFTDPPASGGRYEDFDGGWRLYGTVETEDGESLTGPVVWDLDEAWSWEILDGTWRDVTYDVELGLVESIRKVSSRSVEVTLADGRTIELEGSNDVDRENKGILVEIGDDEAVLVDWDRFERVTFRRR